MSGHSDIKGDETAHGLTKACSMEAFSSLEPFIRIANSLAKLTLLNVSTRFSQAVCLKNKDLEHLKA